MTERHEREGHTEGLHSKSPGLDIRSAEELVHLLWEDQLEGLTALEGVLDRIARVASVFAEVVASGGRVFYVGAGTSGRLALVDAIELPSTFGVEPGLVAVLFPGGPFSEAAEAESREDDPQAGRRKVEEARVSGGDLAIGISASGRTPFVLGALEEAKARGAATAGVTNNPGAPLERLVDHLIVLPTGPELISGSTRLKAGTAQKAVLNMLSTAALIRLGRVYDGYMISLRANNEKLKGRALRALTALSGRSAKEAEEALSAADNEVDTALVMLVGRLPAPEARALLERHGGNVRKAVKSLRKGGGG